MKRKTITSQIKDYYQTQQLPAQKLQALLAMAEMNRQPQPWWKRNRLINSSPLGAIAATLMPLILLSWVFLNYQTPTAQHIQTLVAKEIALNHHKNLSTEFHEKTLFGLQEKMQKLDFPLSASRQTLLNSLTVTGARYCSIQGQMAAQIKLKDVNNTSFTFYQTKLNHELRHIPLGTITQDNVTIIQWQENGLFMALAYTRDPQDFP